MRIKVTSEIEELCDNEHASPRLIKVHSHKEYNDVVVLEIGNTIVAVDVESLRLAIVNATNATTDYQPTQLLTTCQ